VPLNELAVSESAVITKLYGSGAIKRRLLDMGLTRGTKIHLRKVAPLGDPLEISVRGYELTLRKKEAEFVFVTTS